MTQPRNIGACTWIYGDLPLADIAQRLHGMGFDGVELMGDLSAYQPSAVKALLEENGLTVFSVTPDNVDLAHPDPTIRAQAIDYYLRLIEFAAALGQPLISCHGYVGRIRPLSTLLEERELLVHAVQRLAKTAQAHGLRLVLEVLNRYESHLVCTGSEAAAFVRDVGAANVGILLDAYHMNIEESDPAAALRQAGRALWLYHAADSNRQGMGRGHIDFSAQMAALAAADYHGPIILECTAPGPDPFSAIKDEGSRAWIDQYLQESLQWLRQHDPGQQIAS
ncbi:MAG: sugar phosphate isomerase/epimerase [Chloroflexi bacterium]|nr:sugar phosphate isomerase/epimerase [Chloroflexota bacterium]